MEYNHLDMVDHLEMKNFNFSTINRSKLPKKSISFKTKKQINKTVISRTLIRIKMVVVYYHFSMKKVKESLKSYLKVIQTKFAVAK